MTRVAFVTGGAGGIGAAICRSLADAGHRVIVADLLEERASEVAAEIDGLGVALDVTSPESVTAAFARAGAVDICVNCAGWEQATPFLETDEAFTAKILEINLHGPIRVTRAAVGGMIDRGWGRVINVSSDAALLGSSLSPIYAAAKGGLISFTKSIARDAGRSGRDRERRLAGRDQHAAARLVDGRQLRARPQGRPPRRAPRPHRRARGGRGRCRVLRLRGSELRDRPDDLGRRRPGDAVTRLRRACLLVPGDALPPLAPAAGADELILDVHAIPDRAKTDFLRLAVAAAIAKGHLAPTTTIRINHASTRWFMEDVIQFVLAIGSGVDCMVVPGVRGAGDVLAAAELLEEIETEFPVERPIGLEAAVDPATGRDVLEEIARASTRLEALVVDAGGDPAEVIACAAAHGLAAVDGTLSARLSRAPSRALAGAWTADPAQLSGLLAGFPD